MQQIMTSEEKEEAGRLIDTILPVSQRYEGMKQEGVNMATRQRLALESISAPTIIIDAKDVVTFPGSKYTAEHIPNAKRVAFETGGHILVGHGDDARAAVKEFLEQQRIELRN
jgi:hypothetical protein